MHRRAVTIARCFAWLLLLPTTASAGTAFRLDAPSGPVVGINIESDWAADGIVFVNRRGVAKEAFRSGRTSETLRWVSRFGSVSFSMVAREFATTGMNEAGLVLCALHLRESQPPPPDERQPMDSASWVQYALDNCDNLDDVIAIERIIRLEDSEGIPSHFFVADAQDDCAVLEYRDGELVVYRGVDLPIPALTNMPYEKALEARARGGAPWWWANPDRSAERFDAVAERLRTFDGSDAVGFVFETLGGALLLPTTNWSIVYDLAARTLYFRSARMPAIRMIACAQIDFSCESPSLMAPVDAPPSIPGFASVVPFDSGQNRELFRDFRARHHVKLSEEEATELLRFLEGFDCAP